MTHNIRTRTAATDTATTATASVPIAYSRRAATATGSSRPTRMEHEPLEQKVSISHIATACVRVCGEITRGPWRRERPTAATASTPEAPKCSAGM